MVPLRLAALFATFPLLFPADARASSAGFGFYGYFDLSIDAPGAVFDVAYADASTDGDESGAGLAFFAAEPDPFAIDPEAPFGEFFGFGVASGPVGFSFLFADAAFGVDLYNPTDTSIDVFLTWDVFGEVLASATPGASNAAAQSSLLADLEITELGDGSSLSLFYESIELSAGAPGGPPDDADVFSGSTSLSLPAGYTLAFDAGLSAEGFAAVVPLPPAYVLGVTGLAGLAALRRHRSRELGTGADADL